MDGVENNLKVKKKAPHSLPAPKRSKMTKEAMHRLFDVENAKVIARLNDPRIASYGFSATCDVFSFS